MKLTSTSPGEIAARLRALDVRSRDDVKIAQVARELGVAVADVAAAFDGMVTAAPGKTVDVVPFTAKGTPTGNNVAALLSVTKAMTSARRWDPIGRLPEALQQRLSPGDRNAINAAVALLQKRVRESKLDYVPVFGYLSLRTQNFAELGKKSQSDVVPGRDVVNATLPDHDVDVLVSTMFRGTPEHPGAVAGLASKKGAATPGVVLKVPLDRAEELLAVVLAREMFAEGDLVDLHGRDGAAVSNALYAPKVNDVVLEDGKTVPGLVFATNEQGDKAVFAQDGMAMTVERMAYLFAAQGGFVDATGKAFGGPAIDYWEKSYLQARKAAGQPVDPKIAAAVELSKLMPQEDVIDRIMARTDADARLMQDALRLLFTGVVTPLAMKHHQKADLDGLQRVPQGDRGDVEARLLEKARELKRDGKI